MKKLSILLIMLTVFLASVQAKNLQDLRQLKANFEEKYSIQLFFEEIPFSTWKIDYEVVTKEYYDELFDYIVLLDGEFSKYPLKFLWKTRLRAVALVRLLSNSGDLLVTAVPDYIREILFLDFKRGNYDKVYQKDVIHHDFYHMIEQELNGSSEWKDPTWLGFNQPNVSYGRTGWTAQGITSNAGLMNHPEPGFTNAYAKTELPEDKATIYAQLFITEEYNKLIRWAKKDKILDKKVKYMKFFLKTQHKDFNKQFWEELHK